MRTLKINPLVVLIVGVVVYHTFQPIFSEWQKHNTRIEYEGYPLKKESNFYTTQLLSPYIDEFEADAKAHGYDCSKIKKLDSIFWDASDDWQGCTVLYVDRDTLRGYIHLNYLLLEQGDSIGIRFCLYHELGHWLGLEHGKGIMRKAYDSEFAPYVKDAWPALVEDLFDKLKDTKLSN